MMGTLVFLLFFFDKSQIIKESQKKISNITGLHIEVGENSKLIFFPHPRIILEDVKIYEKKKIKKILIRSKKLFITTNWSQLITKNSKINKIILSQPKIVILDSNDVFSHNKEDRIFVQLVNFFKPQNKISIDSLNKIIIEDGELIYKRGKNLFFLKDIGLIFENNKEKLFKGKFFFENISSEFKFDIKTNDYDLFRLILDQTIQDKNNNISWNVYVRRMNKEVFLSGEGKSDKFDINKLNFKNQSLDIESHTKNFFNISTGMKINIDLDLKAKKVFYKQLIFEDTDFNLKFDGDSLEISEFNSNYEDSIINYNSVYSRKNNSLSGKILINNFKFKDWFAEKKIGLIGGNLNLNINFKNKNFVRNKLKENLIFSGFYEMKNPILKGIDFDESIKKLKNASSLNDFLDLVKSYSQNDQTLFKNSSGKFIFENNILNVDDFKTWRENLVINSNGLFNMKDQKLQIKHDIKILEKPFHDLPSFSIMTSGSINALKVKYDLKGLKDIFIEKTLNKLLKKNKKIILDPKNIIDLLIPKE